MHQMIKLLGVSNTCVVFNSHLKKVGKVFDFYEGDCLTIEIYLRTNNTRERTAHFFVNNSQNLLCINNLPSTVTFGVCLFKYSFVFFIFK